MQGSSRLLGLGACLGLIAQESPDTALRIVAEIDGVDEVRISHREMEWVHHSWSWPKAVTVQGRSWEPEQRSTLSARSNRPFVPARLDLAGATLWKIRGRGLTTLGFSEAGLSIRFDDGAPNGAAIYEVLVTFADAECEESRRYFSDHEASPGKPVEIEAEVDVAAHIDGADSVHLSAERTWWCHHDYDWPTEVRFNATAWDPQVASVLPTRATLSIPAFADLSASKLLLRQGPGIVQLDANEREVAIRFDDRQPGGSAPYRAVVSIPIRPLHRVEIRCGEAARAEGAQLRIVRQDAIPTALSGQRVIGKGGRAIVALAAGPYRFEVQHASLPDMLVALVTPRTEIVADCQLKLPTLLTRLRLAVPGPSEPRVDEIGIRSILPTGEVTWRRASPSVDARMLVSPDQSYRVRALATRGSTHAAIWMEAPADQLRALTLKATQLVRCSFRWREGTPRRAGAGLSLHYPDATQELPFVPETELWTNRRFVEIGYWYEPERGRKVVFNPRGYILPVPPGDHILELGGPLQGFASAAILTNENLGAPDSKQLWLDLGLRDVGGHVVDLPGSNIDWQWSAQMKDGRPMPPAPLTPADLECLENPIDTVRLRASYRLQETAELSLTPVPWVPVHSERVTTTAPSYMEWRVASYLAKAERSLREIATVRAQPLDPTYQVQLTWWLNSGAVGGHGGFTMPLSGMTNDFSWYTHPWAISHELLHGLGYGHNEDMDRVDALVQGRFLHYRAFVADHPDFVPDALRR